MAAMNAVFASPSCSSPLSFPRSSSCYRRSIFASNRPHRSGRQSLNKDHSDRRKNNVVEGVSQKRFTGRGKDDRTYLPPDGSRGDAGLSQSQSTVFKSIGTQKRDEFDLKEPQAWQICSFLFLLQRKLNYLHRTLLLRVDEIGKFEDSAFLNAVVKVKVKRRGDDTKFVAKVPFLILANGTPHEDFWKGAEPLRFGHLPCLQVFRSEDAENIGYVIPTTVVSHFLNDYERSGKYTGKITLDCQISFVRQ
ncbi:hypothetical protein B296_00041149 [Ensete ventricosum]|uniref:Uncharacterized protein n=1 Tax=Ensete ventricosum TaxID=4639 RepID=A0A426ZN18_ENSVE|nr:hypothetical protein B296_00041149 [Ensete ventricosum]